jgi:hypothetical protein
MLQLVVWGLGLHLILKGVELRLIAAASTHDSRIDLMARATIWCTIAVIGGVAIIGMSIVLGEMMPGPESYPPF